MSELRRPEYWEPDEEWERYWAALRDETVPPEVEPRTPLGQAIDRARGRVISEEDMHAAIRFGNFAYQALVRAEKMWLAAVDVRRGPEYWTRQEPCLYGQSEMGGGCGYSLANHTRVDGQPMDHDYCRRCSVCDRITPWACSDCRIDTKHTVFVCMREECRRAHDAAHPEHEQHRAVMGRS